MGPNGSSSIGHQARLCTASSSDEVTARRAMAAEWLRGDEHPAAPRAPLLQYTTVAPIPPQPLVESSDW